jgi:phage/plasmid-like protein (TIGR03299 family)
MAHEVENIFYVGETPWHGIGIPLKESPTIREGIIAAGLDWTVHTEPLYRMKDADPAGTDDGFEQVQANCVIRDSDGSVLADAVGPNWTPFQNLEAFEWFEPFVENRLVTLECAGSLREGKRIFVLAKLALEDSAIVPKVNDVVRKYVLLSNGHDGSMAVRVGFTPIRVVCANTLASAHDSADSQLIRVFHSKGVKKTVDDLREVMNLANQEFEASAEKFRFLASKAVSQEDLKKYIKIVYGLPEKDKDGKEPKKMGEVIQLFQNGFGNDLEGVRGTWWAGYNAVTEHLSYVRGRDRDKRLNNLWFGYVRGMNQNALDLALKMAA